LGKRVCGTQAQGDHQGTKNPQTVFHDSLRINSTTRSDRLGPATSPLFHAGKNPYRPPSRSTNLRVTSVNVEWRYATGHTDAAKSSSKIVRDVEPFHAPRVASCVGAGIAAASNLKRAATASASGKSSFQHLAG
jgi:hypothetical protein